MKKKTQKLNIFNAVNEELLFQFKHRRWEFRSLKYVFLVTVRVDKGTSD